MQFGWCKMKPRDRENMLYSKGKRCSLSEEEVVMLNFLKKCAAKSSRVLDVGCGSGDIALEIRKMGYEVSGVDFSSVAVDIALQNGLQCQVADIDEGLPFGDNTFDVAWLGDVIEHVFDPVFVLKEVRRILVEGGTLLATIPYDLYLGVRIRTLFGISYQEKNYRERGQQKHHTFFSKRLMDFMLREASFSVQESFLKLRFPFSRKYFIQKGLRFLMFGNTMIIRCKAV